MLLLLQWPLSSQTRLTPDSPAYHIPVANVLAEVVARSAGPLLEELQSKPALDLIFDLACRETNWSGLRATMLFMVQFLGKFHPGMRIVGFKSELPLQDMSTPRGDYGADEKPTKEVVCLNVAWVINWLSSLAYLH